MQVSILKRVGAITIKFGIISALAAYSLLILKNLFFINYNNWEGYASVVAILFLGAGLIIGKIYFKEEITKETAPLQLLSRRETEVLELLCQQKTNQQIADELCIELSTLKTHINRIYKKLEVKNRSQLIAKACK